MKTTQVKSKGLSPTGVGARIVLTMLPFITSGIILQIYSPTITEISLFTPETLQNAGWILVVPGIILWIYAVVQFSIAFPKGKLITTGLYSISRNPIYVSWILFVLPGLAGILNNWFFLLAALTMYIALLIFIKEEEKQMFVYFGDIYKQYCKRVGRVL